MDVLTEPEQKKAPDSLRQGGPLYRALIVEDQLMVRKLLRKHLEEVAGMQIMGETDNGEEAIVLAKKYHPDICIMDITLKGLNGIEATRNIVSACPKVKVLALTASDNFAVINQMIMAGAKGYMFKNDDLDILPNVVRAVAAGLTYYPPSRKLEDHATKERKEIFSELELQVIRNLCDSLTSKAIADKLGLSLRKVNTYRQRVMQKTYTYSTAELLKYAIKNGIVQIEREEIVNRFTDREMQIIKLACDNQTAKEIGAALRLSHNTVARHKARIMKKSRTHSVAELIKYAVKYGIVQI